MIKTFPTKGTPQGGILSPLLANIVLNELDWWITSHWNHEAGISQPKMLRWSVCSEANNVREAPACS